MAKNRKLKKAAAKSAEKANSSRELTKLETVVLGLTKDKKDGPPYVSLKYYRPEYQCLSTWPTDELKAFSQFCVKMTKMSWPEIYRSGGKIGKKTGLGYTVHSDPKKLPKHPDLTTLSEDLTWFELRLGLKLRVHGFRATDAFFLVYLDREHAIYKM